MADIQKKTQVLVVGGGFGGIRAAERLSRYREFEVTLLSDNDNFSYYPQLYHSATGGSRSESSLPITGLLPPARVKFIRDSAASLDAETNTIQGGSGSAYHYDELVLALGCVTNYFGVKGLQEFSYDIKSITGAERFKQHLHKELIDDKKTDLNYVVVGGGPTGIELAAALGQYLHRITRLHGIPKPNYRLDLVEAAPRLLPRSAETVSARVQKRLEQLGVTVMTGKTVKAETADALELDGETLASKTVVWTAGVSTNPFYKSNATVFKFAKNGKIEVDEHLQARPHVYVIGDNAATQYSGMAQTAIADANYVADDLLRRYHEHPRRPYVPKAPVSVIPVGAGWAAVQWGPVKFYGFLGAALRRLADLVAYMDIETFPKALSVWMQDSRRQDNCPVCSINQSVPGPSST